MKDIKEILSIGKLCKFVESKIIRNEEPLLTKYSDNDLISIRYQFLLYQHTKGKTNRFNGEELICLRYYLLTHSEVYAKRNTSKKEK